MKALACDDIISSKGDLPRTQFADSEAFLTNDDYSRHWSVKGVLRNYYSRHWSVKG